MQEQATTFEVTTDSLSTINIELLQRGLDFVRILNEAESSRAEAKTQRIASG